VLLSPHNATIQESRSQNALSANDYKNENPLLSQPTPSEQEQHHKKEMREVETFLSFYPSFAQTDGNAVKLRNYLNKKGLGFTRRNLEAAYSALVEAGELETNDAVVRSGATRMID